MRKISRRRVLQGTAGGGGVAVVPAPPPALCRPADSGLPAITPRGCQKGACFSRVMQGAERLRYPLKRAGERGEGKWLQISWDEALTEIADAIVAKLKTNAPAHPPP